MKVTRLVIGLVVLAGLAIGMTAGCGGDSEASKAEANKPGPTGADKVAGPEPKSATAAE